MQDASNNSISGWVPTEHCALAQAVFPNAKITSLLDADRPPAILTIVREWMESVGPITADELAEKLTLPLEDIDQALLGLETQGQVLRGQFRSPGEWCDRRLLARIHRRTLGKLRKEIEPVSSADFMRFLIRWQHVAPESRLHGEYGLLEVIRQLAGFEAAASTWERDLLPRESLSIPWWNLLVAYRRLESEGEIRGGRFISGFTGEQFALAEAVESLRAIRRSGNGLPERLKISATDPLNFVGIITPGPKVPAQPLHSVILENA